jgi:hypothetical protein
MPKKTLAQLGEEFDAWKAEREHPYRKQDADEGTRALAERYLEYLYPKTNMCLVEDVRNMLVNLILEARS